MAGEKYGQAADHGFFAPLAGARMTASTRQRLIEAGLKRFYRDGFRSVGIDQVLADVGISKTAFYKHFESKDDLLLAVLDDRNRWLQGTFRDMVRKCGGQNPADQLRALFDVVDANITSDDYRGCLFINVAMEFPLQHEPAHMAAAGNKRAIEDFVAELAAAAGAGDPRRLAEELCLIMEGAYVMHQVSRNKHASDIARRLAEQVIVRYLPGGPDCHHDGAAPAESQAAADGASQ
jgi:AcrR family transcriptional regulator